MLNAPLSDELRPFTPMHDDSAWLAALRRREFARLDASGETYLDYTGSALYGQSQIESHLELLRTGVFGNPHSEHASSRASSDAIDAARSLVLDFFGTDSATHEICFTANATGAIRLVAESFPFAPDRPLFLSADNHNSVNGLREHARRAGAPVHYLPLDGTLRLAEPEQRLVDAVADAGGLVAFPAQSNFSGVRHSLRLVDVAHSRGHRVLLDAAAFVPSHPLDLRTCHADFVALSFYKMFGYPTGLGALIARRDAFAELRRPWFAGGTVQYASVHAATHRLHDGGAGFEDGTLDFLGIAALPAGFELLQSAGMARISAHVARLTQLLLTELTQMRHRNDVALAQVYGPQRMFARGGTIAFNLRSRTGQPIPYWDVESRARTARIALRGGCFCNPGAAEVALHLDARRTAECFAALHDTFTPPRFASCLGAPVGALRISPGLANDQRDIRRALDFIRTFAE